MQANQLRGQIKSEIERYKITGAFVRVRCALYIAHTNIVFIFRSLEKRIHLQYVLTGALRKQFLHSLI